MKRREVAPIPLPDTDDMAVLVRAAAVEKLKAGELRITTQDGLAAQNLLDRREEKKKDRELITQLGVLLSRGSEAPPMLDVTEGEYQVVEDRPNSQTVSEPTGRSAQGSMGCPVLCREVLWRKDPPRPERTLREDRPPRYDRLACGVSDHLRHVRQPSR